MVLGIDDWLFREAFLYQCDGYCEKCSEPCEERKGKKDEMGRKTIGKDKLCKTVET